MPVSDFVFNSEFTLTVHVFSHEGCSELQNSIYSHVNTKIVYPHNEKYW